VATSIAPQHLADLTGDELGTLYDILKER